MCGPPLPRLADRPAARKETKTGGGETHDIVNQPESLQRALGTAIVKHSFWHPRKIEVGSLPAQETSGVPACARSDTGVARTKTAATATSTSILISTLTTGDCQRDRRQPPTNNNVDTINDSSDSTRLGRGAALLTVLRGVGGGVGGDLPPVLVDLLLPLLPAGAVDLGRGDPGSLGGRRPCSPQMDEKKQ